MSLFFKIIVFAAAITALNGAAQGQQQPPFATTKTDGTDNAGAGKREMKSATAIFTDRMKENCAPKNRAFLYRQLARQPEDL